MAQSGHAARAMIERHSEMSITIEHFGHVTQLTLARPEAANAISVEMALALAKAIDAFAADPNAFVLVVTGTGERSFCAGGDLTELLRLTDHAEANRAGPLGFARLEPGKPTIAAVSGHCSVEGSSSRFGATSGSPRRTQSSERSTANGA